MSGQITLLTDFGIDDYFVGAVKGSILSINPAATIVDITHEIPAHDIESAAFTLLACYRAFAAGTVHVAVVDPGVGSTRRAILATAGEYLFVGPDNGIFSYILDREVSPRVIHITSTDYFRQPVSNTFHGRDVFAPIAAAVSMGVAPGSLGPQIDDPVRLSSFKPERLKNGKVRGRVIHVDQFGNCVTNFDSSFMGGPGTAILHLKGKKIKDLRESYAEGKGKKPFAIWGSAGLLEISVGNGSAAEELGATRGDEVTLLTS